MVRLASRIVRRPPVRPAPLAFVVLVAALAGCTEEAPPPEPLRPVRYERVFASGAGRTRAFPGVARAGQEIDLSFRVSGSVERLAAKVGDVVRAGDLIAQLERTDYEIAKRQAQANLEQALASYTNADADLDRIRGLYENDNVSRNELDRAQAAQKSANAGVKASREALAQAERQLDYTTLRVPVDGAIARVDIEVNENVRQGDTVVRMTSGAQAEVRVAMPGTLIAQILHGDPVAVTFSALPGEKFDAVVTEVGVAATEGATTFPVRVRLTRGNGNIRSGMAAEVTFRFEEQDDRARIFLPSFAVGEDRQGRFVFVLEAAGNGTGQVRRTPVVVGSELNAKGKMELLSGLSEGELVVTAGVRRLTDGQKVRLLDDGPER